MYIILPLHWEAIMIYKTQKGATGDIIIKFDFYPFAAKRAQGRRGAEDSGETHNKCNILAENISFHLAFRFKSVAVEYKRDFAVRIIGLHVRVNDCADAVIDQESLKKNGGERINRCKLI